MGDLTPEEYFLTKANSQSALEKFYKSVDLGVQFKLQKEVNKNPKAFPELLKIVDEDIPENGTEFNKILEFMKEEVLPHSANMASPYAMAFPDAGNSIAAISASLIADFANQNLLHFMPPSPIATVIETVVINWMRKLVGYPEGEKVSCRVGGIVTTGGVASNAIATLLAREKMFPGTMEKGVKGIKEDFAVIIPKEIDHYSSRFSTGWMGLGMDNCVMIPTKDFKYNLEALKVQLEELAREGRKVIMLIAYAGDARSMTCDNFKGLRRICDKYGIWLHADACNGTQLVFSNKLRHVLNGIELADSITLDPHKVLGIPYQLSLLLTKEPNAFWNVRKPLHVMDDEPFSFGSVTPFFGSRAWMSLKLYFLIKHLGRSGIQDVVEKRCELAKLLGRKIQQSKNFLLINPEIAINAVMFMYNPKEIQDYAKQHYVQQLNELNKAIHNGLNKKGRIWLHCFEIPDSNNVLGLGEEVHLNVLRFMSGNPVLTEEHLEEMLQAVEKQGNEVISGLNQNDFNEEEAVPQKKIRGLGKIETVN